MPVPSIYYNTPVRHPTLNTATQEWCDYWRELDQDYGTDKSDPLHHDQRCTFCKGK